MQMLLFAVGEGVRDRILASNNISLNANLAKYREDIKAGRVRKNRNRSSELKGVEIMNKDTIIKVLLAIIALMVFAWL